MQERHIGSIVQACNCSRTARTHIIWGRPTGEYGSIGALEQRGAKADLPARAEKALKTCSSDEKTEHFEPSIAGTVNVSIASQSKTKAVSKPIGAGRGIVRKCVKYLVITPVFIHLEQGGVTVSDKVRWRKS